MAELAKGYFPLQSLAGQEKQHTYKYADWKKENKWNDRRLEQVPLNYYGEDPVLFPFQLLFKMSFKSVESATFSDLGWNLILRYLWLLCVCVLDRNSINCPKVF